MTKYKNLIISITALILILAAAYIVYDRYKPQLAVQPPVPDALTDSAGNGNATQDNAKNGQGEQNGQSEDTGGTSDSGTAADNGTPDNSDVIMVPDFTLKDLDGNDVSISDYRGKIIILNFWAVWCKYCVEEMPDFDKLDKELAEDGDAVILAVNVQEPYETVNKFISENDFGLKVLLDEDGDVAGGIFGVNSYPNTFVINKDGSLYTYIPGKTDIETMRTVIGMARDNAPLK